MSAEATLNAILTVAEGLTFGEDFTSDPSRTHSLGDLSKTLNATSTPAAISEVWSDQVALAAGTVDLDLAALARGGGLAALDLTGLKVQAVLIRNPTGNALISIAGATVNPYELLGVGVATELEVAPGGFALLYSPEGLGDVGASNKVVTITGTGTELFDIVIVAG